MRLGILSDTHGLLRPEVVERLADAEMLLHAGDIGDGDGGDGSGGGEILERLEAIAPTLAVAGNVDQGSADPRIRALPREVVTEIAGVSLLMIHRREDAEARLAELVSAGRPRPDLVVFGHSHRPEIDWPRGALFLNPGACGRRRFRLPLTVARCTLTDGRIVPEILAVD